MAKIKCPWCSRILDLEKYQVTRTLGKRTIGYCSQCSRYMEIFWTEPESTPITYKDKI